MNILRIAECGMRISNLETAPRPPEPPGDVSNLLLVVLIAVIAVGTAAVLTWAEERWPERAEGSRRKAEGRKQKAVGSKHNAAGGEK